MIASDSFVFQGNVNLVFTSLLMQEVNLSAYQTEISVTQTPLEVRHLS